MPHSRFHNSVIYILKIISGCALFAAGLCFFTIPGEIVPGGVSGVATLLERFISLPVGLLIIILNIPLFILGLIFLGKIFIVKTIFATVILSLMTDMLMPLIRFEYNGDKLISAVFGGVLIGAGIALIFISGSTTGGTDIIVKLLRLRYPYIGTGRLLFIVDMIIVVASIPVYGNIESGLYSIITVFLSGYVIDKMINDRYLGKLVFIVSDKSDNIRRHITKNIRRGVTVIPSVGGYTEKNGKTLMLTLTSPEFYRLRREVSQLDPLAFIIVAPAQRTYGTGFSSLADYD